MKNWTINKRVVAGFTVTLVLAGIMGILAWSSLRVINTHADDLSDDNIPGLSISADVIQNINHAQIILLRHVMASQPDAKRACETQLQNIALTNTQALATFEKYANSPSEKDLFNRLKAARQNYIDVRKSVLQASTAGDTAQAVSLLNGPLQDAYVAYDDCAMGFRDVETGQAADGAREIQHLAATSKLLAAVIVLAELAVSVVLSFVIISGLNRILRRVSSSLNTSADQVASAAGEVSAASQMLAQGSGEQAASIEETSSSLEEMSSMTRRNADNAQQANQLAKQARLAADKGSADMQTMSAAMEAIKSSSDDIAKIIKTIDEIAFQTNILALNAAVEAARAGEAGMGFAVVADEVRNLAQRSAQAAKETALKIEGAIAKTSGGVTISRQVGETLAEIVSKARQVDDLAAEVAGASREQTQGITQINTAVGQMDKVTQANAASAEQSAAAAQELNAQAAVMKQSVGELLQLLGRVSPPRADKSTPSAPRKTAPAVTAVSAPARNGHAAPSAKTKNSDIPLEQSFKNF